MRIAQIDIERFGVYQQFKMEKQLFSSPITVIYGPNEAGKSTVHSFIRSILFGFQTTKSVDYSSREGMELGGSLWLETDQNEQFKISRKTPPNKGRIFVSNAAGQKLEEDILKKLVGYISDDVYKHIFAFTHQELQFLGHLQNEEITDYLYGSSSGTGNKSLLEVEKKVRKQHEELFRPRAVLPIINKQLKELEEREKELQQMKQGLHTYFQLQKNIEEERNKLDALRQDRKKLENDFNYVEKVIHCKGLEEQLALIEVRLPLLDEASPLLENQDHIRSLYQQKEDIRKEQQKLQQIKNKVQLLEQQMDKERLHLGEQWELQIIKAIKLTYIDKEDLFQLAGKIEASYQKLQKKQEERNREGKEKEKLEHQLEQERKRTVLRREEVTLSRKRKNDIASTFLLPLVFTSSIIVALIIFLSNPHLLSGVLLVILIGAFLFQQIIKQRNKEVEKQKDEQIQQWTKEYDQWRLNQNEHLHYLEGEYSFSLHREKELIKEEEQEEKNYQALLRDWSALTKEKGFPILPSLSSFPELTRRIEAIQQQQLQMEELREQQRNMENNIEVWNKAVEALQQKLQVNLHSNQQEYIIQQIFQLLQKELQLEEEQKELLLQQKQILIQMQRIIEEEDLLDHWRQVINEKSIEEWRQQKQEFHDKLASNLEAIEQSAAVVGQYEARLLELESEEQLSIKNQEFEEKRATFQQLTRKWSVLAVAEQLCVRTRRIFEEERQPKVIQKASAYFKLITSGKYVQIIAPIEVQDFIVVREDGSRFPTNQLSQGTKEQLYLAMRFAVIEEYASYMKLPVIMDDIFVNFDSTRAQNAIAGVEMLSKTNQIIFFTCHSYMVELIQGKMENVQLVRL